MLTADQLYLLAVLRKSFGLPADVPEPGDPEALKVLIRRGGVLTTVYTALSPALQEAFRTAYLSTVRQIILQQHEGQQLLHALAGAGMDCIGLKGWEMRKRYPRPEMRMMADLDILVRPYDAAGIRRVLTGLGYTGRAGSAWKHDKYRKGEITAEIHKRLTDDTGAIRQWEAQMWSRAAATDQPRVLTMRPEDEVVFHFVHLHKDFLNGALGLRRIVDTWLLEQAGANDDEVHGILESFGMRLFHRRMQRLARTVMEGTAMDDQTELLLRHAMTYGLYGTDRSYKAGRIAAMSRGGLRSGKARSAAAAVFLPRGRMTAQYPVLEKWPVLLPWCWSRRIGHFLRGNLRKHLHRLDYNAVNQRDFNEMKRFFEAGGITVRR